MPKIANVVLPIRAFDAYISFTADSIHHSLHSLIDVNDALLYYSQPYNIKCWSDVYVHSDMREVVVPDGRCNDITFIDWSEYRELESISIGDNCFARVEELHIDGLERLKNLTIGENSFTRLRGDQNYNRKFYLTNCPVLKEVRFGVGSFADYTSSFVENLPSLEMIQYGDDSFIHIAFVSFQSD